MLQKGKWDVDHANIYNLLSTLEHEKIHKEEWQQGKEVKTYSDHAKVYIRQCQSKIFARTTSKYQIARAASFISYLETAKEKNEQGWEDLIEQFNSTNTAGLKIVNRDSGGMQLYNKEGKEINLGLRKKLKKPQ